MAISIFNYLEAQFAPKSLEPPQNSKHERVSNFLTIPFQLEKFLVFGVLICFDSLLYNMTILPVRIIYGTLQFISFNRNKSYSNDLLKGILILLACATVSLFDPSQFYHSIRSQSTIKLYVIFNVIEVLDKLFSSFGLDVLDSFFSKPPIEKLFLDPLVHFSLCAFYISVHTLVLLYQVVTLNVAVNSYTNSVLSLLVSNQFMELKSSVFKKFETENLYQLSCADSIERFQLFVYIFIIAIRNFSQIGWNSESGSELWNRILYPLFLIYCTEIAVDGLKHAFITKFNHISPGVYKIFKESLAADFNLQDLVDQSPKVSQKMGFSSLPLTCLVINILMGSFKGGKFIWYFLIFVCLFVIKCSSGLILINWTKSIRKENNEKVLKEPKIVPTESINDDFVDKKMD